MSKLFPVIYLSVCLLACGQQKQPALPVGDNDTALAAIDSAFDSYTDEERRADSLQHVRVRDSFYAIKPMFVFRTDAAGDCFDKLIAAYIDTNSVTWKPLALTDTVITTRDKEENILSKRQICKNKRFVVEVFGPGEQNYVPRKLIINGLELRPGKELDTTHAGMWWNHFLIINNENAHLLKYGSKEYLFLSGHMENCNGNACGVAFYILYDPLIKKAMLLEQLRTDFNTGYDKKNNTPVFIVAEEGSGFNDEFNCYIYSAKVYRFDNRGKVKAIVDKSGKPLYYKGYYKAEGDSIVLLEGNSPK